MTAPPKTDPRVCLRWHFPLSTRLNFCTWELLPSASHAPHAAFLSEQQASKAAATLSRKTKPRLRIPLQRVIEACGGYGILLPFASVVRQEGTLPSLSHSGLSDCAATRYLVSARQLAAQVDTRHAMTFSQACFSTHAEKWQVCKQEVCLQRLQRRRKGSVPHHRNES